MERAEGASGEGHGMFIRIQLVQPRVDQAHRSVQRKAVVCTAGGGRLRRRLKKNSSLWSTPPSDTTCRVHAGKCSTVTWSERGGGGVGVGGGTAQEALNDPLEWLPGGACYHGNEWRKASHQERLRCLWLPW